MEWIVQYDVVQMSSDPMYGNDRTLETGLDADAMITHAEYLAMTREDICVIERRFCGGENYKRGIEFDSHIIWADWLEPKDRRGKGVW